MRANEKGEKAANVDKNTIFLATDQSGRPPAIKFERVWPLDSIWAELFMQTTGRGFYQLAQNYGSTEALHLWLRSNTAPSRPPLIHALLIHHQPVPTPGIDDVTIVW